MSWITRSPAPAAFERRQLSNSNRALTFDVPNELIEEIARRAAELVIASQAAASSPWLDTKGAANYIAAKPGRIHDLVALGKLTPRRDGRRLLFARCDLDAYLEGSA